MPTDQDFNWRFIIANNLLVNASDILHHVAEKLADGREGVYDTHQLKTNLSSVQSALECLLKFKLAWKDWRLLVKGPKLTDASIKSGDFKTITFDEVRKALKKPPFTINMNRLSTKYLYQLRKDRHKHTHYKLDISSQECLELIAHGIDFCLDFYEDHIHKQFFEDTDRFQKIDLSLKNISIYTTVRIATARKKYPNLFAPLTAYFDCCSNCDQTAPVISSPHTVMCLFCKQEDQIAYMAENIGLGRRQTDNPTRNCPECYYHSMGAIDLNHNPESWQCVICGYFTNEPEFFNNVPGGLLKQNIGKPHRSVEIRWTS